MIHLTANALAYLRGEKGGDSFVRACDGVTLDPDEGEQLNVHGKLITLGRMNLLPTCPKCAVLWDEAGGTERALAHVNGPSRSSEAPPEG